MQSNLVMFTENQLLPISALQHYLYCPRQCALIHLEQVWADNRFTAEGNQIHARAHDGPDESRPGIRITRSLPVRSLQHGITGQCDIVEFHDNDTITPVEYKRGKPKTNHADEVQLCAQALCLEEMLGTQIPEAFLYYGKRKRRTPVQIDTELRHLTHQTIANLHTLIKDRTTPAATYDTKKCPACSLINLCQPKTLRLKNGAASWFQNQLKTSN